VGGATDVLNPNSVTPSIISSAEDLQIQGNGDVNNHLASGGVTGALTGAGRYSGAVTLIADSSIGAFSGQILELSGAITSSGSPIGGSANLTKVDTGILYISSNTTYRGRTTVSGGTLRIGSANGLGADGTPVPDFDTTVNSGATLEATGTYSVNTELLTTLNGMGVLRPTNFGTSDPVGALSATDSGSNVTWTRPVVLGSSSFVGASQGATLAVSGSTSGVGNLRGAQGLTLTKVNDGLFILDTANTDFLSNTTIDGGTMIVTDPLALGPNADGGGGSILVNNPNRITTAGIAGSLQLQGTFTFNKSLTLNELGYLNSGALKTVGGAATNITYAGISNWVAPGTAPRKALPRSSTTRAARSTSPGMSAALPSPAWTRRGLEPSSWTETAPTSG
jgi:autotransporter-associated beta strand protein